jgi:hypothetical protein
MLLSDAHILKSLQVKFTNSFVAGSPVTKIEEIYFKPKHQNCHRHWTYRINLQDGRLFAVSFTNRQLGWLRIVIP